MSVSPSLNPHVSVDCVIFGFSKETLRLLLIKRTVPNAITELDDSYYALPGDLVRDNENLDEAAARVVAAHAGKVAVATVNRETTNLQALGNSDQVLVRRGGSSSCRTTPAHSTSCCSHHAPG